MFSELMCCTLFDNDDDHCHHTLMSRKSWILLVSKNHCQIISSVRRRRQFISKITILTLDSVYAISRPSAREASPSPVAFDLFLGCSPLLHGILILFVYFRTRATAISIFCLLSSNFAYHRAPHSKHCVPKHLLFLTHLHYNSLCALYFLHPPPPISFRTSTAIGAMPCPAHAISRLLRAV